MAREMKKEAALSPEERLEKALLPAWEQPYKVPNNWRWTSLGSVIELIRGVSYNKEDAHKEKQPDDCLILRGGNVEEGSINTDADNVYVSRSLVAEAQLVKKHDVIIVSSTGSTKVIGRAGISLCDYEDVAFGAFLITARSKANVNKQYMAYYFQSDLYRDRIRALASGVNINNIRAEYITETPLAFPPVEEQQRIVDRIESLFAKLDEAKEKAQEVLDSFEIRKAAMLHEAFDGRLTQQWRERNVSLCEEWKNAKLGEFSESQYGYTVSASSDEIGPHFLRITDIQNGNVCWEDVPYCKIEEELLPKYAVCPNDIMIARTGATTGKSYLITENVHSVFASYLIRLKVTSKRLTPEYLYAFMQSPEYWQQITEFSSGIAQPGVNAKKLKEMVLPVPSVPEQIEIVRLLDAFFAKEAEAKVQVEATLEAIDLMEKSILAKAFSGELGTNDPAEESAEELLKQVLSEDVQDAEPKKRSKSIPKEVKEKLVSELERKLVKLYFQRITDSLPAEVLLSSSSKTFEVMECLHNLEQRQILKKLNNGNYRLLG